MTKKSERACQISNNTNISNIDTLLTLYYTPPQYYTPHNNTCEKMLYFFMCVDVANQLLTCHLPLAPLGQVDE